MREKAQVGAPSPLLLSALHAPLRRREPTVVEGEHAIDHLGNVCILKGTQLNETLC